jgi:hypothetical protein
MTFEVRHAKRRKDLLVRFADQAEGSGKPGGCAVETSSLDAYLLHRFPNQLSTKLRMLHVPS